MIKLIKKDYHYNMKNRKMFLIASILIIIFLLVMVLSIKTYDYEVVFFENETTYRTIDIHLSLLFFWVYDREIESKYKIEDIEFVNGFIKFGEYIHIFDKDKIDISARIKGFGKGVDNTELHYISFENQINENEINNIITNEINKVYNYKMKRKSAFQNIVSRILYWIF